jgi:hypothetical protein
MHGHRLGDLFGLAAMFCLLGGLVFYQRLLSRLKIARGQLLPRARGANVFELFREYRQVYGTNDLLPQICMFWMLGFMILFSASLIFGGWF